MQLTPLINAVPLSESLCCFRDFLQLSVTSFHSAVRRPKSVLDLDVTQPNYNYSVSAMSISFNEFFLVFSAKQHSAINTLTRFSCQNRPTLLLVCISVFIFHKAPTLRSEQHTYHARSALSDHLVIESFRTDLRKFSSSTSGKNLWNNIPSCIRQKPSKKQF